MNMILYWWFSLLKITLACEGIWYKAVVPKDLMVQAEETVTTVYNDFPVSDTDLIQVRRR